MKLEREKLARRDFLIAAVGMGTALVPGCSSIKGSGFEYFDGPGAETLKALCDQIIPADDFPSASEAGVLVYIDRQLGRHYRRHRNAYRDGLEQADGLSRQRFGRGLADLGATEQAELVSELSRLKPEFFNLVRSHTFEGYYGAPRHGGNRDAVSWRMLGIDEPPLRGRAQYDQRKGQAR